MSASMCASALSLLAPDTPAVPGSARPAATSPETQVPGRDRAPTHGPRTVSIPMTTCASSVSLARSGRSAHAPGPPATPLGRRPRAGARPARPSPPRRDGISPVIPPRTAATALPSKASKDSSAANGRTVNDLIELCSPQHRRHDIPSAINLPATSRGTVFPRAPGPGTQLLTCQQPPAPSLPDG